MPLTIKSFFFLLQLLMLTKNVYNNVGPNYHAPIPIFKTGTIKPG